MQCQSSDRSGKGIYVPRDVKDVNENTASSSQVWHQRGNTRSVGTSCDNVETSLVHHNFSRYSMMHHLERVFSNVRQKLSRPEGDEMLDVEVNGMIWRIFMSATRKAAVHLGQDYEENLRKTKNTDFEQVKALFEISKILILIHKSEIYGISTVG